LPAGAAKALSCIDDIVAAAAEQAINTAAAIKDVTSVGADDLVGKGAAVDFEEFHSGNVEAGSICAVYRKRRDEIKRSRQRHVDHQEIDAGASVNERWPIHDDPVGIAAAVKFVAGAAVDRIVARLAEDRIAASAAAQFVIPGAATDDHGAVSGRDRVRAAVADQRLWGIGALQGAIRPEVHNE